MRKIWTLFVMTLLSAFFQPAWAQGEKSSITNNKSPVCRVRVRIVGFDWQNPSSHTLDKLSANQLDWWLKEGQKKFPGVCLTTTPGVADYIVRWSETSEDRTYTYTVPKRETTQHSGTVNATSTGTSSTGGSSTVYTTGTYNGTSTTTTYEKKQEEYSIWYVVAGVHRMSEVNGQKEIVNLPVFITKHKGQWRWSKPDKDALAKSLKYIAGQVK